MTSGLPDHLGPGLRVIIAGTTRAGALAGRGHYYNGPGNNFWLLLHESGLVARMLSPDEDDRLPGYGVGVTDLVRVVDAVAGQEPVSRWLLADFTAKIAAAAPDAVAFVSKTAASSYARAAGERLPRGYGELSWTVAGRAAFVLPGPSGANNGMPLPLRIALWRDLVDFLDSL